MALEFLKGKKHFKTFLVTIRNGEEAYKRFVDSHHFTIGRSDECELIFPDPIISRKHLSIKSTSNDEIFVEDLGSANGVTVNGVKIEPKTPTSIKPEDLVGLINTKIILQVEVYEKLFTKQVIDQSALTNEQKEALHEIILGANQQAERITALAQEHAEKLREGLAKKMASDQEEFDKKLAEKKQMLESEYNEKNKTLNEGIENRKKILQNMQLELENSKLEFESSLKEKEEKILSDAIHAAQEKAQTILENSKAEIEKNRIEFDTDRRNKSEDLERYIKNTLQEAEQNKNKILEEAEDRKKILLEEAQKAIDELNSENIKIAQDIIAKAKREAIESAEKERQIIIEQALVDAKSKGEAEVERILKQNEVKISTQTAEIEKLEETSQKLVHEQERKIRLIKEDAEREISTKRHELELQSEKLNLDIEKRTSEFEETYEKKKNQSEEELSRLENEIKYNKEHLQVILNKRNDELDAIFKKHQLSLERAAIEKEKDLKSKLDKDLKSKRLELADIEENIKIKNKQINESMGEIETLDNQLRKAKETLNSKTVEIEKAERTFDELQERTNEQQSNLSESIKAKEEIEKRAAALKLELEEVKSQLEDLRKRKSVEGEKVEQEIRKKMDGLIKEREKQIQEEFSLEQKKIDHYREKWKKELNDNKQRLLTSLVDQSTRYFSNSIDSKNLKTAQTELEEKLKLVLDQEIASSALLAEEQKATKSITHKKKGYKGNREVIHGFIAGALVVTCFFVVKASLESKSVSALVDLEQKNRADDLAARQFRPEQTSEVKENYTDAVIYTKDFTSLYLDNDVQNRWAKQAKDYFFENWRVPEETVIEVVSKAKVLVQNLKEKRENIHPDFVDKNIEKMRQFEADEVKALKEKLGTNVKFEAFKKLETRFFTNEMAKRQPATQDSN